MFDESQLRASRRFMAGLLASSFAAITFVDPAIGDVFTLDGGGKIEGEIVEVTGNIIAVRRSVGGIQQFASKMVTEISLTLLDGNEIKGEFIKWDNGIHHVRSDGKILQLRAGELLSSHDEPANTGVKETLDAAATPNAQADRELTRQTYVPPPIYVLSNGTTFVGRAVNFNVPFLTIRRATGGQQTLRVDDLREVVIRSPDGVSIAGEFLGWSEGVFELRSNDRLVRVQGGEIIKEGAHDRQVGGPLEKTPLLTGQPIDVAIAPISLSVSAEHASEHDEAAILTLKLSRPAPQPIAIIYSMTDGTADQDDYRSASGVLTIKAGADTSWIRIPLIDDTIKEEDETIRLFLAADPALVDVTPNRVVAVIKDND